METAQILEWIGYLASVIVALSLMMTAMVKLRWTNLIGALVFTIYGISIQAVPVVLVNGFIVLIDVYYLVRIYTNNDYFTLVETDKKNPYLMHFIAYYESAIARDFPRFNLQNSSADCCVMILRNMDMAGLFIGSMSEEGTLVIDVDYAAPKYQDFKTGQYLFFDNHHLLSHRGVKRIVLLQANKHQQAYYKKMGFKGQADGSYIKYL